MVCIKEPQYHIKKKTLRYKERNEESRKCFLKNIEEYSKERLVYLDESVINEFLYREYGRAPRDEEVFGEISGKRYGRESFIAGLSNGLLIATLCFEGTCDALLFNIWLKNCLVPVLQGGQIIILDNASFHEPERTKSIIEQAGCILMFLPPYSPDLNPIEKVWAHLKSRL